MKEVSTVAQTYRDAEGYDSYMGGWSEALAPLFLEFAAARVPHSLLDIGCGTGNLLAAALAAFPGAALTGVDPSRTLLDKARRRPELGRVTFVEGTVEELPFEEAAFDCSSSLLVLQEFSDRFLSLREMRRVTRAGGVVAACQWDFSRMPVIRALVDAISAINPEAGDHLSGNSQPVLAREDELADYWIAAGFDEVSTDRVKVTRTFQQFDHLWRPLLAGSTPSTLTLASLSAPEREKARELMRMRLTDGTDASALQITAEALVVRGRA
jgi:ubiquinone/menaquinone biosynthesis C-methylase UbiE